MYHHCKQHSPTFMNYRVYFSKLVIFDSIHAHIIFQFIFCLVSYCRILDKCSILIVLLARTKVEIPFSDPFFWPLDRRERYLFCFIVVQVCNLTLAYAAQSIQGAAEYELHNYQHSAREPWPRDTSGSSSLGPPHHRRQGVREVGEVAGVQPAQVHPPVTRHPEHCSLEYLDH